MFTAKWTYRIAGGLALLGIILFVARATPAPPQDSDGKQPPPQPTVNQPMPPSNTPVAAPAPQPNQPPAPKSGQKPYILPGVGTPAGPNMQVTPGIGTPAFPGQPPVYPQIAPGIGTPAFPGQPPIYPQVVPGAGTPAYPFMSQYWRLSIYGEDVPGWGVRITYVYPYGAAERMGLEVGDIIVQINGYPIRSMYDLRNALAYSNGYARILSLDNRTWTYQWVQGYVDPMAAPATPATPGVPPGPVASPGVAGSPSASE